jgi:hypothetical protein
MKRMAVHVICPSLRCRKILVLADEVRGTNVTCRYCQMQFRVPQIRRAAVTAATSRWRPRQALRSNLAIFSHQSGASSWHPFAASHIMRGMADTLNYAAPGTTRAGISLVKVGGALAIAGTIIGAMIFVAGCFGFSAAFMLSLIPTIFGAVGSCSRSSAGSCSTRRRGRHARARGDRPERRGARRGLLEIAIWRGVPIFAGGAAM